jgi:4-aminobutyrate aminotransferase-like enzyme
MAYSAVNFGYRNPFFLDAMKDQLETLPQIASEYLSSEKIHLSARICQSVEERWGLEGRVHFNVGGSQAVEDSLKLVAANRGRRRVFAFEGSYHGRTLAASSLSSSFRYRSRYGDFGDRACFVPFPYCFRCPYGKSVDSCGLFCADQVARLFESEYQSHKDMRDGQTEFVAFYAEAIQGTGGYVVPPEGYFPRLKRILDEHGILLVIDDIQMGFHRTGRLWSIEHFGVTPDILLFGKSLTNGLNPLSGLWARECLIAPDRFPPGSTHSSFAANPIGARLGLATFEWIDVQDYERTVPELGAYLLEGLRDLARIHPEFGDVDALGLAARVEICHRDGFTPNRALADRIKARALDTATETDEGPMRLVLDIGGYFKNVFTLAPPLDIDVATIDRFLRILDEVTGAAKREMA